MSAPLARLLEVVIGPLQCERKLADPPVELRRALLGLSPLTLELLELDCQSCVTLPIERGQLLLQLPEVRRFGRCRPLGSRLECCP